MDKVEFLLNEAIRCERTAARHTAFAYETYRQAADGYLRDAIAAEAQALVPVTDR